MTLTETTVSWRGTTLYGAPGAGRDFVISTLDGWEELPPSSRQQSKRPIAHGMLGSAPSAEGRVIRVAGLCRSPSERDAHLAELGRLFAYAASDAAPEDLTIDHAGLVLTAQVYVARYRAPMDLWGAGKFRWAAEFEADDPLRYGPVSEEPTGFAQDAGGLEFDLFTDGTDDVGVLEFGDLGSLDGLVTLLNPGNSETYPQYLVDGPVPDEGFELVSDGSVVRFAYGVPAGSTLTVDSGTGTAFLGSADYSEHLTVRDWWPVPAAGSRVVLFRSLGGATSALMTARVRPAYW